MKAYKWVDSNSDGMCGFVTLRDPDNGNEARVRWSVTSKNATSQHEAAEEAHRRLRDQERALRQTFEGQCPECAKRAESRRMARNVIAGLEP